MKATIVGMLIWLGGLILLATAIYGWARMAEWAYDLAGPWDLILPMAPAAIIVIVIIGWAVRETAQYTGQWLIDWLGK